MTEELKKASDIVAAINSFAFESEGIEKKADIKTLENLSLSEMLSAVAVVNAMNDEESKKSGTRTIYIVPDDRLTAAVYTFLHFYPAYADNDGSGDEFILKIADAPANGRVEVGFLMRGAREISEAKYHGEEAA